ncbi:MAG: hypothetical protein K0R50_4053, partial [Eubacterium sp.]|nr:hypothetical protein [Eubacterium sp.]
MLAEWSGFFGYGVVNNKKRYYHKGGRLIPVILFLLGGQIMKNKQPGTFATIY